MKTILVYCGRVVEALLWERETAEGKRTSSRYLLLKEIGYLSDTDREKKKQEVSHCKETKSA